MSTDCHIRKLRIRTRDKAVLPRMTFAIEDAFRTASFPGVPPNGRVFVKRLDLGNFSSAASSRFLAGRIDEQFRHIRPVMICQDTPELIGAPAVWFPDDLSPYRFLVNLLSQNRRPRAWYWKAAVKGWHPSLSVHQSFQVIVSRVCRCKTGILGMYFVLEPLLENGRILDVIDTFNPRDVTRYLFNMGLSPVSIDSKKAPEAKAVISKENQMIVPALEGGMVTQAAGRWSFFDPRFALVSYLILARMDQATDPVHLNSLLETVSNRSATTHDTERRKEEWEFIGISEPNASFEVLEPIQRVSNPSGDVPSEPADLRPRRLKAKAQEARDNDKKESATGTAPEKETSRKDASGFPDHTLASDALKPQSPESKTVQSTSFRKHVLKEIYPILGGFAGEITEYAGLFFTIPLMKIIGMDTLMEQFPAYEDLDLPRRILFRCADLLFIPPDHPVIVVLGKEPEPSDVITEFTPPPQWRRILPEPIRSQERSLDRLVDTIVTVMERYCRDTATMEFGELIRRPGYIAATKTHLDLTFPFSQLDIRVRMAGLDINPGWVPWLGRVFQFHYVGGDG